jgi:hypothetical protein
VSAADEWYRLADEAGDTVKYKRFMQRTTIGGDLPTVPQ